MITPSKFKQQREAWGLTHIELAYALHCSANTISKYENHKLHPTRNRVAIARLTDGIEAMISGNATIPEPKKPHQVRSVEPPLTPELQALLDRSRKASKRRRQRDVSTALGDAVNNLPTPPSTFDIQQSRLRMKGEVKHGQ